MSFMSVPALDRLLEPSETELTSVQRWSAKANKRVVMNMSPLFPCQPHDQQSPPQSCPSLLSFSSSPYVLNINQQVFDGNGTNDGIVEPSCYDLNVAIQRNKGQVHEATSSFRGDSEVVLDHRNKMINNKSGMLPVREVQDHLSLEGKLREGQKRPRVKSIKKTEKLMTNPVIKTMEATDNGHEKQDSDKGLRGQFPSIGQQNRDFSSIFSLNQEEFFDALEEPFEDTINDEKNLQAYRTSRTISGGRRDTYGYLKLQLYKETKRRMAAEDAMAILQLQCTKMASHLTSVDEESHGLNDYGQNDWDNDFHAQKLVVAQVVAYSVARGASRAEIGKEMENVVVEKNREIARLQDKIHYYELVNHEMSQRNQEAFELARSKRYIRRNWNQWLMVCAGSAICVGVSAILVSKFAPRATYYFPSKSVVQSHMRTNVYHLSPSDDI